MIHSTGFPVYLAIAINIQTISQTILDNEVRYPFEHRVLRKNKIVILLY